MPKFLFADTVIINDDQVGVIVKTWEKKCKKYEYEVYNRMTSEIEVYQESDIERYRVRHKYLSEEEIGYQNG